MKKVLIVSTSFDEQRMVEKVAMSNAPGSLSIETTGSFGQDAVWWLNNAPDALVLKIPDDNMLQTNFLNKVQTDVPKTIALVILCKTITSPMMQVTSQFARVRILKEPVDGFNLYRSVADLLVDFDINRKQISPRYLTNQSVVVTSDFKSGRIDGLLKNLSATGAYFESEKNNLELKINDLVRLQIVIPNVREYVFDGKIVWVKNLIDGRFGCGVTFVGKDEVYNKLLKQS